MRGPQGGRMRPPKAGPHVALPGWAHVPTRYLGRTGMYAARLLISATGAHVPTRHTSRATSSHVPTRHHPLTMSSTTATGAAGARGPREWWRGLPSRQRRILRGLFAVAVVVVLVVGALLARFLSAENAERSDDLALVQAEARGDLAGMLAQLSGCRASPSCLASARA